MSKEGLFIPISGAGNITGICAKDGSSLAITLFLPPFPIRYVNIEVLFFPQIIYF